MRVIPLFPASIDTAPVMGPESWSLQTPKTPLMGFVGKRQTYKQIGLIGDGCTMCKRHEKRELDGVIKPRFIRGSDPTAEKLLCVFSYNDYGLTVDRIIEYIRTFHNGHILIDLPVRCGSGDVTDVQLAKCRPYLTKSFLEFKPDRIICFGGRASSAVLGVAVPAWANRWCWTTIPGFKPDSRIPVVISMDPTVISKSRVHKTIIEDEVHWAITGKFHNTHPRGNALVVEGPEDLDFVRRWVAEAVRDPGWVAFDVESNGVMYNKDFEIIACSFSTPRLPDVIVWDQYALFDPELLQACIDVLQNPFLGKKGSNVKYDTEAWKWWKGVVVNPVVGDSRLEMKQANPDSRADLESMGFYVGINAHKTEAKKLIDTAKKQAKNDIDPDIEGVSAYAYVYKYLPPEVMLRYNALDTYVTGLVCDYSRKSLGVLEKTFHRLILPANEMYASVEETGMAVERSNITIAKAFLEGKISELLPRLTKAGIDPDKPDSIREWLDRMGLESPIETDGGQASTSAKALGLLQKTPGLIKFHNEIIADVLSYRKLAKLLCSYADTLPGYIRSDGRVHPSFLLDGARSGRASCIAGDQRMWTNHGWVRFDELGELLSRTTVYTISHTGAWRRVTACWPTGTRETVEVVTSDGKKLRCTPDHQLRSDEGWVQAGLCGNRRIKISECSEMGALEGEGANVRIVASDLAGRSTSRVGTGRTQTPTARAVGMDVFHRWNAVARRTRKFRGVAQTVLQQHKELGARVRRVHRAAPRQGDIRQEYRQYEGGWTEGCNTGPRDKGYGVFRANCVAAPHFNRVERVGNSYKPEGARAGARNRSSVHPKGVVDVRGLPLVGEAKTGFLPSGDASQAEPRRVLRFILPAVARHGLPHGKTKEAATCGARNVQRIGPSVLCPDALRRGKQPRSTASSERDRTRTTSEGSEREPVSNRRLYRGGQGRNRGGRITPQTPSEARRRTDRFLRVVWPGGASCSGYHDQKRPGFGNRPSYTDGYRRVTSVTPAGYCEVFDFTVEVDHSGAVEQIIAKNCRNPALQTIPSRGDLAKLIKNCFVARPGYVLVASDFSILEIRVAAILSGDPEMRKAALTDFHTETAKSLSQLAWGLTPEQVEAEIRSGKKAKRDTMKVVGFSVLYGAGAESIAEKVGCSVLEAQTIVNGFFNKYSLLRDWLRAQVNFARENAMVEIPWLDGSLGRIRPLLDINSADAEKRANAKNAAGNCVDYETEALTQRGWVKGPDLNKETDLLLTKNLETGALEWQHMTDLKLFPLYSGTTVEFKSKSFSAVSTPAHRWPVYNATTKRNECRTTDTLAKNGTHRIHRTGTYVGKALVSDDFVELCGWYLTDGSRKQGSRGAPAIVLYQSQRANPDKVARIDELILRLGVKNTRRVRRFDLVEWRLSAADPTVVEVLSLLPSRILTHEFMSKISGAQAKLLVTVMILGDGSVDKKTGKAVFTCRDQHRSDLFQELATLAGYATTSRTRDFRKYGPRKSDKTPNTPKATQLTYNVTLLARDKAQVVAKQRAEREGPCPVWCPVVPNTFFVARRKGAVYITGNTPIQSLASDICMSSAVRIHNHYKEHKVPANIICLVHDSIISEVRADYVDEVVKLKNHYMTDWETGGVPLKVEIETGTAWGSMTKVA